MASIYEIAAYAPSKNDYVKNEIVTCGDCLNSDPSSASGRSYYNLGYSVAVGGNTNGIRPEQGGGDAYWGGNITFDNKTIPHFFWIPNYSPSVSTDPTVRTIKFGDGYEQRTPDGINTRLLKVSLVFDKRNEAETTAISHFLHQRGGSEAFAYLPPSPYSSMKKFVCRSWDVTMNFENNYSIKVELEEVVE